MFRYLLGAVKGLQIKAEISLLRSLGRLGILTGRWHGVLILGVLLH